MDEVNVKFGEWIEKGFNLYKENFGILVLASLIAVIVSAITVGVLAGPMAAGVLLVVFQLHDRKEPKPEVGTLLKGFDFFLNSFLFFHCLGGCHLCGKPYSGSCSLHRSNSIAFRCFCGPCAADVRHVFDR